MKYEDFKNGLLIIFVPVAIIAGVLCRYQSTRVNELNSLLQDTRVQLAHAQIYQPLQSDTIRDTVKVITQQIVEVERADLVKERIADKQLIKELQLRASQLESIHQMGTQTSDTIRIYIPPDSVFRYHDHWTDIKVNFPDSMLTYSVRDSTQIIVAHDYKHRFLWWRWGVKGYKVKVVNFNPHATILYNSYVKAK